MVSRIKTFLQSLTEVQDGKYPPDYYTPLWRRTIILGNFCYLIAALAHVIFILIFLILEVYILALFNILSVTIWVFGFFLHRKGYIIVPLNLVFAEVIVHVILCIIIIGWRAGFQYYLIYAAIVFLVTSLSTSLKITWESLLTSTYLFMYFYSIGNEPLVKIKPLYLEILYQSNIVILCFLGAVTAYFFYKIIIKIEQDLVVAHNKTHKALEERNQFLNRLEAELSEAADYVKKILPHPIREGAIQTNWRFVPSTSLGGDAFGYHKVDQDHFAVYLIDVSGHGVGAALLSASVINVLRSQSLPNTEFKDPVQVLKALNMAFPSDANKDMFFTIWYGVFNTSSRELIYASAGHPPAILCDEDSSCNCHIDLLKTPNFVVGGIEETNYVKDKCEIPEGNTLYIFSDGVYEVEKSDGTNWHFNEFVNYLKKVKTDGQAVMDQLYDYVRRKGKSDHLEDDFTIVEVVFG
jgi:sigma-B regulation protein RsbU (phosphoserine phosphatase)